VSDSRPNWARLFRIACSLIRQVNAEQMIVGSWSFGGGTAMMLQINHRESHDVDIFLPDTQLLSFLDPKLHDFKFESELSDYAGDGAKFIKLAFEGVGEIDFIVGHAMMDMPTIRRMVEGESVELETVAEVIAKKIHYRGASIKPRDIFDIAAAAKHDRTSVLDALTKHKDDVTQTLIAIEKLKPDFVKAAIAELDIKAPYKSIVETALDDAKDILRSV
jgi:hypothetical protein